MHGTHTRTHALTCSRKEILCVLCAIGIEHRWLARSVYASWERETPLRSDSWYVSLSTRVIVGLFTTDPHPLPPYSSIVLSYPHHPGTFTHNVSCTIYPSLSQNQSMKSSFHTSPHPLPQYRSRARHCIHSIPGPSRPTYRALLGCKINQTKIVHHYIHPLA